MKMFLLLLVLTIFPFSSFAESQADAKNAEFGLNRSDPEANQKYRLGTLVTTKKKWVQKGIYDFSKVGGAAGTAINLRSDTANSIKLPKGAIISDCILDFVTATASGGSATISIGTGQSTTDLVSALAVASGTGLVACTPVGSAATAIKMTADRTPTITIGTAALTAGKIYVMIEYWLSDSN